MTRIPIRSMITATKGHYLLSVDFAQAESYVVAYLANEKKMKFELHYGELHSATARVIYNIPDKDYEGNWIRKGHILMPDVKRYIGKKSNHANSYRQGYLMYVTQVNKEGNITISNTEGKRHHTIWHDTYHVKSWWTDLEIQLASNHFLITPYGRKRYFHGVLGNELYKEATAFIPQSSVADHVFGKTQKELGIEGGLLSVYKHIIVEHEHEIKCINTAHDSAIFEIKDGIDPNEMFGNISKYMKRPMVVNGEMFTIPLDGEVGTRFGELDKLKVA